MKTSEKEGVNDRPPTATTCPDVRHRSSAAAVDVGSAHLDAVQAGSDTRAAPTPLPAADAVHYVIAIAVDVDTRMTNGFRSYCHEERRPAPWACRAGKR
jgi:hypothetical protein